MSSVHSEKLGKRSVRKRKPTNSIRVALRFIIHPQELREDYVKLLDRLIKRVEKIINSTRTKTSHRLRAMQVLSDLIKTSYGMVRDVEMEQLERQVETLEKEEEGTYEVEGSSEADHSA